MSNNFKTFHTVKTIESFLDQEQVQTFWNISEEAKWHFHLTEQKNSKFHKRKTLRMYLKDVSLMGRIVDNIIEKKINDVNSECHYEVRNAYLTGHFFGMTDFPDCDSESSDDCTLIINLNKEWDFLWGGQTIFFDCYYDHITKQIIRQSTDTKLAYPVLNQALFFPSNIFYYTESTSKDCPEMRLSLTILLEKKKNKTKIEDYQY